MSTKWYVITEFANICSQRVKMRQRVPCSRYSKKGNDVRSAAPKNRKFPLYSESAVNLLEEQRKCRAGAAYARRW